MSDTTDEMFDIAVDGALSTGLVGLGDTVVITAGVPAGRAGTTNLIKVHHIGELVAKDKASAAKQQRARSS